jgi:hypothetical protein
LSPDGRFLAASRPDGRIFLFDAAGGRELAVLANPGVPARSLEFRADGNVLASGNEDGTALLWDVSTLRLRGGRPLDPGAIDPLWTDLAGADAPTAYSAMQKLVEGQARAVETFAARLRATPDIPVERLRRRVVELDHAQFGVRQAAARELARDIDQAEPVLRASLQDNPSAERRRQIEALLDAPPAVMAGEELRALRAVEVLERIGSPEARRLLDRLAGGAPAARLTRDAKAALDRLNRQPGT